MTTTSIRGSGIPPVTRQRTAQDRSRVRVVWGCAEHRTSRGTKCGYCADQGELFPRRLRGT